MWVERCKILSNLSETAEKFSEISSDSNPKTAQGTRQRPGVHANIRKTAPLY